MSEIHMSEEVSMIAERLSQVTLGEVQKHHNLTMIPMLAEGPAEPGYRLLDDAISSGVARVTEVSSSGSVPELKFINEGDRPVLLLDGEELIGAKQNRILNLTVLAPANQTIVIPVSCVEAGRWSYASRDFVSARRAHFAEGRARRTMQVSRSMRDTGTRRSDQGDVWSEIRRKSARLGAESRTEAAAEMYQTHRENLDDYKRAVQPIDGQAGALFAIDGQVLGCDIFDSPATLARTLPMLVESFALDAIDGARRGATDSHTQDEEQIVRGAEQFVQQIAAADIKRFPAVGEGEDFRLEGKDTGGGALVFEQRVVHLCAFRAPEHREQEAPLQGRMQRASRRRFFRR